MNNDAVANQPIVPPNIPDWEFFNQLHSCRNDFGRTNECRQEHRLMRRTLLKQLHLMAQTVCVACGGRAHRARDCPTNLRLGMLSSSNAAWAKLVAWTRVQVAGHAA